MVDNKYNSRKFVLACFFAASTTVGLYFGHIDAGNYIVAIGLVLGLYGSANVASKKVTNDSNHTDIK